MNNGDLHELLMDLNRGRLCVEEVYDTIKSAMCEANSNAVLCEVDGRLNRRIMDEKEVQKQFKELLKVKWYDKIIIPIVIKWYDLKLSFVQLFKRGPT